VWHLKHDNFEPKQLAAQLGQVQSLAPPPAPFEPFEKAPLAPALPPFSLGAPWCTPPPSPSVANTGCRPGAKSVAPFSEIPTHTLRLCTCTCTCMSGHLSDPGSPWCEVSAIATARLASSELKLCCPPRFAFTRKLRGAPRDA
jgi:hypothetical protein